MNSEGAYSIDSVLRQGKTWRATRAETAATQNSFILKRLPEDCLRQGRLHPNIQLRLTRLRELPLQSFVNLVGVERMGNDIMLVTEFVEGTPLTELSAHLRPEAAHRARLVVQSLHNLGFVHGNVHGGNLIVEPDGNVLLIDPSPLLHDDPTMDLAALDRLWPDDAVERLNAEMPETDRIGRRSLVMALGLSVVGGVVAVGLAFHFWVQRA